MAGFVLLLGKAGVVYDRVLTQLFYGLPTVAIELATSTSAT